MDENEIVTDGLKPQRFEGTLTPTSNLLKGDPPCRAGRVHGMWKGLASHCCSRNESGRLRCCATHHHQTILRRSLQRTAEVESTDGDPAETERLLTVDKVLIAELAENLVAGVGGAQVLPKS